MFIFLIIPESVHYSKAWNCSQTQLWLQYLGNCSRVLTLLEKQNLLSMLLTLSLLRHAKPPYWHRWQNRKFSKNVILYKKCPRWTKFTVKFVYVTWFLFFFRWIVLFFSWPSLYNIMNVGMHTRPKSILSIFVQLKCWTQHSALNSCR